MFVARFVQVEWGVRRDEEQSLVLEGALGLHRDDLERLIPGVRDVLVELLVLLVRDLVFGPGP